MQKPPNSKDPASFRDFCPDDVAMPACDRPCAPHRARPSWADPKLGSSARWEALVELGVFASPKAPGKDVQRCLEMLGKLDTFEFLWSTP